MRSALPYHEDAGNDVGEDHDEEHDEQRGRHLAVALRVRVGVQHEEREEPGEERDGQLSWEYGPVSNWYTVGTVGETSGQAGQEDAASVSRPMYQT